MVKNNYFGDTKFDKAYFTGKSSCGYPGGYTKENLLNHDYDYNDFAAVAKKISQLGVRTYFEIGCARGYLMEELLKLGVKVKGWDVSEYIIKKASKKVKPFIEIKDISEIKNLPDKSFDLVHVSTVLGYAPLKKLDYYLKEIKRIAKKFVIVYSGTPEDAPEENSIRLINKPDDWWNKKFSKHFALVDLNWYLWKPD
ncbi:MAG: hypothetical protein AUJ11_02330 [Parcubacteria group bacterium CG1_02_44_65]|nr:MAG: hypothetical protein AUJ11_02330 [Parcubacteria group bacterium CG1_02_44_65]